jgi:nucleoside-diphosphate-sugar epimerase
VSRTNVLVVGATGFIGGWLCRAFNAAGAQVVGVCRTPPGPASPFRSILADLTLPGSGAQLIERTKPDLVVNAAGYGVDRNERDPGLARRLNAELVEELAVAIVDSPPSASWPGQRMIHLGSAFECGSVSGTVTEETACSPATDYGRTKLDGTRLLAAVRHQTGLQAVTVRVATVYGPGEHPHRLLPSLLRAADTAETLQLTAGEQERDFTYVADVAEGAVRLARCRDIPGPILNLATGELHTVREFATRAREMLGIAADRVIFGALPYRPEEVWQGRFAVDRLHTLLGWRPSTRLDEGIRATIALARMTEGDRG